MSALAEVRPDLFLDGEALANRVALDLLKIARPDAALKREPISGLRSTLYSGSEFHDEDRPNAKALLEWMMSKPDGSILPHELIGRAAELEGNSVQRALILCWDVLRRDYHMAEERNAFSHILKLRDITGELELFDGQVHQARREGIPVRGADAKLEKPPFTRSERGLVGLLLRDGSGFRRNRRGTPGELKTVRGDNFSAWYHFMGTALNSFHRTASRLYPVSGRVETGAMIFMEEKVLHNEHLDPRKRLDIDKAGAIFGDKLARNLRKYKNAGGLAAGRDGARTEYLYDSPERYGAKWRLKEGQHPRDFGTDRRTRNRESLLTRVRRAKGLDAQPESFSLREARLAMIDDVQGVRGYAAEALAGRRDRESLSLVVSLVKDPPFQDAGEDAVEVLARRRDPEAWSLFTRHAMKAPDPEIRRAALDSLGLVEDTGTAREWMRRLYERGSDLEKSSVVYAASDFEPSWKAGILRKAIRSDRPVVYRAAASVLAQAKDPESLGVARELMAEARIPEIPWAKAWKTYLGGDRTPEWRAARRYVDTKVALAEALSARDDPAAWNALSGLEGDADKTVRDAARSAGSRGTGEAGAPGRSYRPKSACPPGFLRSVVREAKRDPTREGRIFVLAMAPTMLLSGGMLSLMMYGAPDDEKPALEAPLDSEEAARSVMSTAPQLAQRLRMARGSAFHADIVAWAREEGLSPRLLGLPADAFADEAAFRRVSREGRHSEAVQAVERQYLLSELVSASSRSGRKPLGQWMDEMVEQVKR